MGLAAVMNAESAVRSAKGSYPRALEARGVSFDVARSPVLLSASHTRMAQEAPGGSRGTPGCMPSRVPCDVGFEPGNCVPSSGMDGGVVFMSGVPGFPPGASWTGDETDSRFKGSAKQRSQADSCSDDALPSHSAQHQKSCLGLQGQAFPRLAPRLSTCRTPPGVRMRVVERGTGFASLESCATWSSGGGVSRGRCGAGAGSWRSPTASSRSSRPRPAWGW